MRWMILFSILILALALHTDSAYACGGGAPFFIQDLDDMDIIVHAKVLDVDDRGYNAILQVDQYFKGNEGSYLAVVRYPAALEVVSEIRGYDTSCLYAGGGQEWVVGSEGYFALKDNDDGTYTDSIGLYRGMPHFFIENGMVKFNSSDPSVKLQSFPYNEFESLLLEYGRHDEPVEPDAAAYPLMRFLNITTESGTHYRLNPDRSLTELDPEISPLAISNDGSHVVFRVDEDHLGFQYLSLERKTEEQQDGGWLIPQNGQAALFSPDSNFTIAWDDAHLTVYMFDNYERGGYGQRMNMQAVASSDLVWSDIDALPRIAWSADSTTIAFEDERGIWIWDIFESSQPELVVQSNGRAGLIDLSTSGRYVRYGSTKTWILLDVLTGEIFENAIITPDESNLIYIRGEYPENTPDVNRHGDRECQTPLAKSCPIYIQQEVIEWFWYKNNQIALLSCGEEACYIFSRHWQLAIGATGDYETQLDTIIPIVSAIAYDIQYDQPVVAVDGYTLEFGFYPNWQRDEPGDPPLDIDFVDLSGFLDSPIAELEWGQPIFYQNSHQ